MNKHHHHPKPQLNRLIHYGAAGIVILLVLTVPLQIILNFLIGAQGGFIISALVTLLLAAPVLMLTTIAPAVTVQHDGLTLHPIIWKERFIPWEAITAVKVFPLLPGREAEVNRRWMVGKKNYRPADGIMLVIPSLPVQYRITGFFAGAASQPVIAITNRAHTDYDTLVKAILTHTDEAIHDTELFT